jgi:hypothetical protein
VSKLTSLAVLNLSNNIIEDIHQIEKFKSNISIKELDLSGNPVCELNNYREIVIDLLPDLKSLDKIPVLIKDAPKKGPLNVKRLEIEELVGRFLKTKGAPNSREASAEAKRYSTQSPSNVPEEHKRQSSDMVSMINHSGLGSKTKGRDINSMNYNLNASHKAPLVNLDVGKKNDESGLFSYMYDQDIDHNKSESQYALKEIINIQEDYIKKRSLNIYSELIKNWRNKVFQLIFESKRSEILNAQKFKILEKDKLKLIDELDNANYTRDKTLKEYEAIKNELRRKHHEFEHNKHKPINDNMTSVKTDITSLIISHAKYFEEQEQKFSD